MAESHIESLVDCPAGHPAACVRDGVCGWCETRAAGERDAETMRGLYDEVERLRADVAEAQALLALYSGGARGHMPSGGWESTCEDAGCFRQWVGDTLIEVEADGSWSAWRYRQREGFSAVLADHPGPRPILVACAAAEAWLAAQVSP